MKILVTAGPTREPIDPVRFISNRSSGKMGYAVARAAARRGHAVILLSGPVALAPPVGVKLARVVTAREMLAAVRRHVRWCGALVMTAAVSDWRPQVVRRQKLKKSRKPLLLRLAPTTDILLAIRPWKGRRIFVGFAAETRHLRWEAARKLAAKGLDLIVANDVSRRDAGFESDNNRVTLMAKNGYIRDLPLMPKAKVAERIIRWIETCAARKSK